MTSDFSPQQFSFQELISTKKKQKKNKSIDRAPGQPLNKMSLNFNQLASNPSPDQRPTEEMNFLISVTLNTPETKTPTINYPKCEL